MKILLLITTLTLVECRPQTQEKEAPISIEKKQEIPYKVTTIPFYGGAQGQALQLVESSDGIISSKIVILPTTKKPELDLQGDYEMEQPGFGIKELHKSANKIINLQEKNRKKSFNRAQQDEYENEMEILNEYAKNIADLQLNGASDDFFSDDGLSAWFDRKRIEQVKKKNNLNSTQIEDNKKKDNNKTSTNNLNVNNSIKDNKKDKNNKIDNNLNINNSNKEDKNNNSTDKNKKQKESEKKKEKEENKDKQPEKEEEEEEEEEEGDAVVVNLPPDDASVAEAKPVGLAVAGAGGVAASKPVATAVVGPAGLAIARPVGTAIAGVDPEQALVPIFAQQYVKPSKKRGESNNKKQISSSDLLNKIISKYHQI
ncbi:putative uncharacterized protein DDB_G0275317 isoform X2 [Onthophagus taurus]|uniref:putative uncharacterized protein DDB_G0275317 isoform X2 n=1 Tax=Onthophagus taurus TaxID=166361 RepID=UPI0039BE9A57